MNYSPTFCLDLEPDEYGYARPRNEWPYGHSYLSMAQHQAAFYNRQSQQNQQNQQLQQQQQETTQNPSSQPSNQQSTPLDLVPVPYSAADDWGWQQAILEMSSPSSMSSLSSMPPGLTYSAVTLDGTEADPLVDLPVTSMTSAASTASALPSEPSSLFTKDSTSPSDHLGPGAGRGSSTSRRPSPGKEKASSPEKDVAASAKTSAPKDLEFITAGHPSQFKDKRVMKKVRSVVMSDYVSKNETRRAASASTGRPAPKSGASKRSRTQSNETTSEPRPSVTSAPESRVRPSMSLPIQTLPQFVPGQFSPNALIVQSPSGRSTSSNDSDFSLSHKQLVHRRYQQALDLLLSTRSPSGLQVRPGLIEFAEQHFFDREQRRPTPLRNFLGAPLDAFRTMPQSSSRKVNVAKLKFSCAKFFGTRAMGASWVPAMLHNRLAFLSTLCMAAAHEDAMHCRTSDSDEMTAIKTEVTHLMIYEMQSVDNLEIMAILEHLCSEIIRTGADESQLYMHSQSMMKFVKQKGGLQNLGLGGDLAKFLTTMTFNIAVFCEIQPHTMYLQFIDSFKFPPPPPPEFPIPESPIFCPRTEFFTLIEIRNDEKRNRRCNPHTYELLTEMRDLTNHFCVEGKTLQALDAKAQARGGVESSLAAEDYLQQQEEARRKFQRISSRISQKVARLHSALEPNRDETNDWYYEAVRLCSCVYTHALTQHQPFSLAATALGTTAAIENGRPVDVTYPRALMLALIKSGIDDCWADMAGVLFWITLVGSASGRRQRPATATPTPGAEFVDPFSDPSLTDLWAFEHPAGAAGSASAPASIADPFASVELAESSMGLARLSPPTPTPGPSGAGGGGGGGMVARGETVSRGTSSALSPLSRRSPLREEEVRRRAEARKWLVALAIRCSVLLGFSHGVPLMGSLRRLIMVQGLLGWGGRRMSASPW